MTGHGRHQRPTGWRDLIGWWRTVVRVWWAADEGRVTAFVVVLTVAILGLAGLTLDGGLALATKVKAHDQAEAAARAGAQALDLTAYRATHTLRLLPADAVTDAQRYLSTVDATGSVSVAGNTVTVTVTATQRTQLLGLIGIESLTVHSQASASPERGVLAPEP